MEVEPYWDEMRRYYACIVGKYGAPVQKALQKVSGLKIDYICPTHGPVWKEHIAQVVEMYRQMSLYESEPGLVIAYGSMYGNTEQMAEAVAAGAAAGGVRNIRIYNTSYTDTSFILRDIFKYRGLVVGSPTYMNEIFPTVEALLLKVERRGVKKSCIRLVRLLHLGWGSGAPHECAGGDSWLGQGGLCGREAGTER
jgi:flavorubredoxin